MVENFPFGVGIIHPISIPRHKGAPPQVPHEVAQTMEIQNDVAVVFHEPMPGALRKNGYEKKSLVQIENHRCVLKFWKKRDNTNKKEGKERKERNSKKQ